MKRAVPCWVDCVRLDAQAPRPPVKATTWLLWFGPFLLLIGGIAVLGLKLHRGRPQVEALPEADMQRAAELLRAPIDMKETK